MLTPSKPSDGDKAKFTVIQFNFRHAHPYLTYPRYFFLSSQLSPSNSISVSLLAGLAGRDQSIVGMRHTRKNEKKPGTLPAHHPYCV